MAEGEAVHVNVIDWHIHPFRADRWFEIWLPGAERMLAFGATRWTITRSTEDPLTFRQTSFWRDREDFELYWASDEITAIRQNALKYYSKPLLPIWHRLVAGESAEVPSEERAGTGAENG